jgi:hypothetical protein
MPYDGRLLSGVTVLMAVVEAGTMRAATALTCRPPARLGRAASAVAPASDPGRLIGWRARHVNGSAGSGVSAAIIRHAVHFVRSHGSAVVTSRITSRNAVRMFPRNGADNEGFIRALFVREHRRRG